MVLSGGETAPLRAREEATTGHEGASSSGRSGVRPHPHGFYEAGDDVLLGERAFPVRDEAAAGSEDTRKRIRKVLYSSMMAATMVSHIQIGR